MQIPETLHIMHCFKSPYANITPFFSALQANPSDSANDTKTAPISCYGNRGGSLALFVLFQALTQSLAGVLDCSLSGCQNYRALGFAVVRCFRFEQAISRMILNPAADFVLQATAHSPNT